MEWVEVDTDVISLTHGLLHVTVGADTGSLESLVRNVLGFEEDEADAVWEDVGSSRLCAGLVTLDTWIWDTTAEARLRIRAALEVAVATSWSTAHYSKAGSNRRVVLKQVHCSEPWFL